MSMDVNGSHYLDSLEPRIVLGSPESSGPSESNPNYRSRSMELGARLEQDQEGARYGQSCYLGRQAHLASNLKDLSPSIENGQGDSVIGQSHPSSEYPNSNSKPKDQEPNPEHSGADSQGGGAQSLRQNPNCGPSSSVSEPDDVHDQIEVRRDLLKSSGKYPDQVSSLRDEWSYPNYNRGDSHSQRNRFREHYKTGNSDFVDFGVGPSNPKRSATLPSNLQSKAISRLMYEENDRMYGSPKRQTTFDTKNSETFDETAPWDQKAILSLDGGGIRGYSALLILRELMKAIKNIEMEYPRGPAEADGPAQSSYHPLSSEPQNIMGTRVPERLSQVGQQSRKPSKWLPCHYFDYMAGTSTGGLISIMLGRLRMNIDDCIFDYETLGGKVFGHPRWFHLRSPLWWPRDKYNHRVLKEVVMDVVRRRAPKIDSFPGGQNFSFDENRCRTVVVSYQEPKDKKGLEQPYLFRTYKNLRLDDEPAAPGDRPLIRNPGEAQDILIWQVARATSAAPGYFKPVKIDGLRYLDGGFGANNPCGEIVEEVRNLNNQATKCVRTVVSIGTGKNKESSRLKITGPTRFINFLNVARQWASDSEREHTVQRYNSRSPGSGYDYFRLNVEDGLGAMKLDEWRCRGRIRTTTGKVIGTLRLSRRAQRSTATAKPVKNGKPVGGQRHTGTAIHLENLGQSRHDPGTEFVPNGNLLGNEPTQNEDITGNTHSQNSKGPQTEFKDELNIPEWFHPKTKTLETIRKHTYAYLERADVKERIKVIAQILVRGRRDRARSDPQRWEKACFGAWYQCKLQGCPRGEKEYALRDKMAHHLLDKHENNFSREDQWKLDRALDDCKIVVL